MPTLFTRDPDAVLQSLRHANACQPGTPSPELAACPAGRFCSLPDGGELCVYELEQSGQGGAAADVSTQPREITGLEVVSVAAVLIAGIAVGRYWPRSRKAAERK